MTDQSTQSRENRSLARRSETLSPFAPFRQLERMFEDFFNVFGPPAHSQGPLPAGIVAPRIDVSETEKEIRIHADLPGLRDKDVELTLDDDVLTIRGQAHMERDEEKEDYHVMERAHGSFARSLRLPYRIDANQVQASFTDGVLSITIPKPQEALQRVQRIEVKRAEGPQQPGSQGQSGAKTGGESPADNTTRETTAD